MKEQEVIRTMIAHIERQFPKTCGNCGREFGSLREYLEETCHHGEPISYDAEAGNFTPSRPVGTMSLANCSCGSTVAITSDGMNILTMWRLMSFARKECRRRGMKFRELLTYLRNRIDEQVLSSEPGFGISNG